MELQRLMHSEDISENSLLLQAALRVFWAALPQKVQQEGKLQYRKSPIEPPSETDRIMTVQFIEACIRQTMFPHNFGSPLVTKIKPSEELEIS